MDCRRVLLLLRKEEISISKAVEMLNDKVQENIEHEKTKRIEITKWNKTAFFCNAFNGETVI